MKRKRLHKLSVAVVGAVTCLGIVMPKLNAVPVSNAAKQAVRACIPGEQVAKAELVSSASKVGKAYYLLAAYQEGDPVATDLLISVDQQGRCSLLLYNPMGDVIPLSRFAPIDVAQSLEYQRIKQEIDSAGGKSAFQQSLNAGAAEGSTYWAPEEIWAMRQLGIQLPKNIKLIDPKDIKVSEPTQ